VLPLVAKRRQQSRRGKIWTEEMDDVMEQLHEGLDLANIDRAVDAIVALSMADEMPKGTSP